MTTEEIINLAKEKLGRDIKEQEAQDYINGNLALPDEALEMVSGGCRADALASNLGTDAIYKRGHRMCNIYRSGFMESVKELCKNK